MTGDDDQLVPGVIVPPKTRRTASLLRQAGLDAYVADSDAVGRNGNRLKRVRAIELGIYSFTADQRMSSPSREPFTKFARFVADLLLEGTGFEPSVPLG